MAWLLRLGMGGAGLALALFAGCSGEDSSDAKLCVAGQSQACAGPLGCSGAQVCAADGMSFGACD